MKEGFSGVWSGSFAWGTSETSEQETARHRLRARKGTEGGDSKVTGNQQMGGVTAARDQGFQKGGLSCEVPES